MRYSRFFCIVLAGCATAVLTAQNPPAGTQPPATQQQDTVRVPIGPDGRPPRLAVPEFIPLSQDSSGGTCATAVARTPGSAAVRVAAS